MSRPPAQYDAAFVISDAHLGLPDDEIFREDLEGFIDFLASNSTVQVNSHDGSFQVKVPNAIVLLGDFLDLWDGRLSNLPAFSAHSARVLTEMADVFYLRGNHDYIIPNITPEATPSVNKFEICEYKVLELGGTSCFFIHGHQFMSAFGPASLKLESYVNPYYSMMESFFSRFSRGRGRQVLLSATALFLVLGMVLAIGQPVLSKLPGQAMLALWILFGVLLPVGIVTIWRLTQKMLWKTLVMILGDKINILRGAVRGDTIEYLTAPSRPISRWFKGNREGSAEARMARYVCFGHTHIPEGPSPGKDKNLYDVKFLNTGSWVRPPSKRWRDYAEKIRIYTRPYDKIDEYLVIIFAVLTTLSYLGFAISPLLLLLGMALLLVEPVVVFGKSSFRRIPGVGLRSLAFIGKDVNGVWRAMPLCWDPGRRVLSSPPSS
mgnify:CR=1 FL=1